jgi:hypothetical protein
MLMLTNRPEKQNAIRLKPGALRKPSVLSSELHWICNRRLTTSRSAHCMQVFFAPSLVSASTYFNADKAMYHFAMQASPTKVGMPYGSEPSLLTPAAYHHQALLHVLSATDGVQLHVRLKLPASRASVKLFNDTINFSTLQQAVMTAMHVLTRRVMACCWITSLRCLSQAAIVANDYRGRMLLRRQSC